jgi:hypothetical protein
MQAHEMTYWSTKTIEPSAPKTRFFDAEQSKDFGTNLTAANFVSPVPFTVHRVEWDVVAHAEFGPPHGWAWRFLEKARWSWSYTQTDIDGSPMSEGLKETALGYAGSFTPLRPVLIEAYQFVNLIVLTRGIEDEEMVVSMRVRMSLRGFASYPWGKLT